MLGENIPSDLRLAQVRPVHHDCDRVAASLPSALDVTDQLPNVRSVDESRTSACRSVSEDDPGELLDA